MGGRLPCTYPFYEYWLLPHSHVLRGHASDMTNYLVASVNVTATPLGLQLSDNEHGFTWLTARWAFFDVCYHSWTTIYLDMDTAQNFPLVWKAKVSRIIFIVIGLRFRDVPYSYALIKGKFIDFITFRHYDAHSFAWYHHSDSLGCVFICTEYFTLPSGGDKTPRSSSFTNRI